MENEWIKDKTVVVVGASSGVGKYLTFNLILKFNCIVIAISNNQNEMEEFNERLYEYHDNFCYHIFDACKEKSWIEFVDKLKQNDTKVDILINCVGELPKFTRFENHTQKEVTNTISANFFSSIFSIRHMLPLLKKSEEPGIVNISCISPSLLLEGTSIYTASKSALISYTQILSQELDDNFYVGLVLLGMVKTDFYKHQKKEIVEKILNRAMTPSSASKKILYGMCKKKKRMVVGFDAKFFDGLSRVFPTLAPKLIKKYLKLKKINLY